MTQKSLRQPAVFVDRDGTLIEEHNFLYKVADLRLFPFTRTAVEALKAGGFLVIVVTNQSGIGRGLYGESEMNSVHDAIQTAVDGKLDGFYFCPHLPDAGCGCRKPSLGMIESACEDFDIDMENSWMVGDKDLDVYTGKNAGLRTVLVRTGYGASHVGSMNISPDIIADDLGSAVAAIVDAGRLRPVDG